VLARRALLRVKRERDRNRGPTALDLTGLSPVSYSREMRVNIHEAKTHLSRLVDRAAAGEEIVIGRAGKPIAKLVAYRPPVEMRQLGAWAGRVSIAADFDDFDEEIERLFEVGE
jgi:prevent-host-death family protein